MLCTRCHEHEAMRSPSPEARDRMQRDGGATWPFPDDICSRCLAGVLKNDPEVRARLWEFQRRLNKKLLVDAGEAVRSGVLHVMNWADLVVERWGPK
jgi:hypothetical protein